MSFNEGKIYSYLRKMFIFWKTAWIPLPHPDLKEIPESQKDSRQAVVKISQENRGYN